MTTQSDQLLLNMLNALADDEDLTRKEKQQLKQPVTKVRPDNIFTWHLDGHTVFEDETDPEELKHGVRLRRAGVKAQARLSDAQIAAEEARLGIRLPEPWRQVYTHFNGGFTSELYWGDMNRPRWSDAVPVPQRTGSYLALEEVLPLRDLLPQEIAGIDPERIDPRLIAIAFADGQAVLLDYRTGDDPRACLTLFSEFDEDPLEDWEGSPFTTWWPDMTVFFAGLYRQDRII